jgi:hypothetical protein
MSLISGNVTFGADAINCSSSSILGAAAFIDTASNQGTVSVASFSDTAVNEGTVVSAVFGDGAVNVGSLTSGTFLGTAVNSGVVDVAEFFGTASNVGVIVEAAKFADTSSNVGVVSGSAIFADTSVSNGVVEGAVQLGVDVTEGENQALTETPTEYSQPNGFFPNAHYSGGSKTAPASYESIVHQVGGFWYKYDGNGDGSLASGNYSDGTASLFTFASGIKGASVLKNGPYSDGYFVNGNKQSPQTSDAYIAIDNGVSYYYDTNSGDATIANGWLYKNAGTYIYYINGAETNLDTNGNNPFNAGTAYNQPLELDPGEYQTHNGLFYQAGVPYTGNMSWSQIEQIGQDQYANPIMGEVNYDTTFLNGEFVETNPA